MYIINLLNYLLLKFENSKIILSKIFRIKMSWVSQSINESSVFKQVQDRAQVSGSLFTVQPRPVRLASESGLGTGVDSGRAKPEPDHMKREAAGGPPWRGPAAGWQQIVCIARSPIYHPLVVTSRGLFPSLAYFGPPIPSLLLPCLLSSASSTGRSLSLSLNSDVGVVGSGSQMLVDIVLFAVAEMVVFSLQITTKRALVHHEWLFSFFG